MLQPSFAIFGGTEKLIAELYPALAKRGHKVTLFTTDVTPAVAELLATIEIVDIGPIVDYPDDRMLGEQARVGRDLADQLLGFDCVRMHSMPSPIWWLHACEAEPALKGVVSNWCCHGIMGGAYDHVAARHLLAARATRRGGQLSTSTAILSRWLTNARRRGAVWTARATLQTITGARQHLASQILDLDRRAVTNLGAIVSDSRFVADYLNEIWGVRPVVCPPALRAQTQDEPLPPGDVLLTVGRLQESKNLTSVLSAIRLLRDAGDLPFSRYVIVGDGAEKPRLIRHARGLGIDDVVTFEGAVPNERLHTYFDRCGLFILPALDESFGLVFLEAADRGRASIAPDHGGPSEIVVDGETGWLVDPMNVGQIAATIRKAFEDREDLERRGRAAKRRVQRDFTLDRFVECTEAVCGARSGAGGDPAC